MHVARARAWRPGKDLLSRASFLVLGEGGVGLLCVLLMSFVLMPS